MDSVLILIFRLAYASFFEESSHSPGHGSVVFTNSVTVQNSVIVCIIGHMTATSFRSLSFSAVPLLHRAVLSHALLNPISLGSFGQGE